MSDRMANIVELEKEKDGVVERKKGLPEDDDDDDGRERQGSTGLIGHRSSPSDQHVLRHLAERHNILSQTKGVIIPFNQ